jgi:hypothetical protein
VNELTLVLANHISDKVIDDVIEGLGKSYKVPYPGCCDLHDLEVLKYP